MSEPRHWPLANAGACVVANIASAAMQAGHLDAFETLRTNMKPPAQNWRQETRKPCYRQ
jgi:hypothetical protein